MLSGLLLVLLGVWGGLVPFIGPYFHYAYTPDKAWTYTTGRLWLEILPGVATALGGLILLASARRPVAMFGAFMAALGGAWFVVGNLVSTLWNGSTPQAGVPVGSTISRLALEELGFFIGLGVVIVFFAALALGRCAVVGVKDAALAERAAVQAPYDGPDTDAAQPARRSPARHRPKRCRTARASRPRTRRGALSRSAAPTPASMTSRRRSPASSRPPTAARSSRPSRISTLPGTGRSPARRQRPRRRAPASSGRQSSRGIRQSGALPGQELA